MAQLRGLLYGVLGVCSLAGFNVVVTQQAYLARRAAASALGSSFGPVLVWTYQLAVFAFTAGFVRLEGATRLGRTAAVRAPAAATVALLGVYTALALDPAGSEYDSAMLLEGVEAEEGDGYEGGGDLARKRGGVSYATLCYSFAVFWTFTASLMVFPSVTSSICSEGNPATVAPCDPDPPGATRLQGDLFAPLTIVVFDIGDVLGRFLAGVPAIFDVFANSTNMLLMSVLRTACVPALVLCNVVPNGSWAAPVVFRSDVWPFAFMLLFATSNGLSSSCCMAHGAAAAPHNREQESSVLLLLINLGLSAGSLFSWFLLLALER